MISLVLHKWMRNTSPEMLLLVPILWLLPLTGAAPSQTTEQLDMGVVSFLPLFYLEKQRRRVVEVCLPATAPVSVVWCTMVWGRGVAAFSSPLLTCVTPERPGKEQVLSSPGYLL